MPPPVTAKTTPVIVPRPSVPAPPPPPAKEEAKPADSFEGAQFAPKGGITLTDGRLSANVEWSKLPSDLKTKVDQQTWRDLPEKQRNTLVETYARFKQYGVWDEVKTVVGEKNETEPNVRIGDREFEVAGNSGGIKFEAYDGERMRKKLQATKRFGLDGGAAGAMHKGQHSLREWTPEPSTSLHVSIDKKGNTFDTHVDKVSPVNEPQNGKTKLDAKRGPSHHANELWPEMIRNVTRLPGVKVDLTVKPGSRETGKPEGIVSVGIELKGPVKSKPKLAKMPRNEGVAVPEDVMKKVMERVESSGIKFPVPKGVTDIPDRAAVAQGIAAKIMEAAQKGENVISMDFVDYAHQQGYQEPMLGALNCLAHLVREEMMAAKSPDMPDVSSVNRMQVTFGVKTQGGRVAID